MNVKSFFSIILLATICFSCIVMAQQPRLVPQQYATIYKALQGAPTGTTIIVDSTQNINVWYETNRIVISPGITVKLNDGVKVIFAYGMEVNSTGGLIGTFITSGTERNKVRLSFYGGDLTAHGLVYCNHTYFTGYSGFNWSGIWVIDSCSSGSCFNFCVISQVDNGEAALAIQNTNSVTVSYCDISNLSTTNTATSTGGIYSDFSNNIRIYKNKLQNNRQGVVANTGTYMYFGKFGLSLSCDSGNNAITNNQKEGILAHNQSYINASSAFNCHYNNISNNNQANNGSCNATAWTSTISADYNYGGGYPSYWNMLLCKQGECGRSSILCSNTTI